MIFAPALLFGMGKKEVHKSKTKNQKVLPSAFSLPPSVEVNLLRFHHATSPSSSILILLATEKIKFPQLVLMGLFLTLPLEMIIPLKVPMEITLFGFA